MERKRILITGFQAFHNIRENPSELLLEELQRIDSEKLDIETVLLPVTWQGVKLFVESFDRWEEFDGILATGLNEKSTSIQIEQRAVNCQRSNRPDNSGVYRTGEPVIEGKPLFLDTGIDTERLVSVFTGSEYPVQSSLFAGEFVCNALYYALLFHSQKTGIPTLFIHLPLISDQWSLDVFAGIISHIAIYMCKPLSGKGHSELRFQSVKDAENFLYGFINYEMKNRVKYNGFNYNLKRYRRVLKQQIDPHLRGRSIHVAGTKGKGCVSALIASVLSSHGFRTGLYTSPHLVDIRERIRLNGKAISESDFIDLAHFQFEQSKNRDNKKSYRTTFEFLTSMAFQYFRKQHTDWDVYETGMGGRLDCTNVVTPIVSVISRIGMDHTESLGETLLKIASEKAGIIKANIPVISGRQVPAVAQYLQKHARSVYSPLTFAASDILIKNVVQDTHGSSFSARLSGKWLHNLRINLPGKFQLENCRLALAVIQSLSQRNYLKLNRNALIKGLAQCKWPGRFTVINSEFGNTKRYGTIILDGAHNPCAVKTLLISVCALYPNRSLTVIFGCAANKDVKEMISLINSYADRIVLTAYKSSRSMSAKQLSDVVRNHNIETIMCTNVKSAVKYAEKCIMQEDLVVITGSLYLSGECFEILGMKEYCMDIY
jgi:dihydrofolate synthase / folylpolyglutamate synthase